jgi:hypothetical protein
MKNAVIMGMAAACLGWGVGALAEPGAADAPSAPVAPVYAVEDGAFVRHNGDRFNNRPLYGNQLIAVAVGGDRPLLRFGLGVTQSGTFMLGLARGGTSRWLHEASDITMKYRPGRLAWIVRDAAFPGTTVVLEAVPPADGGGLAVWARVEGAQPGDRLVWACGGAFRISNETVVAYWDVTTGGRGKTMERGFRAEECQGNLVAVEPGLVRIATASGTRIGTAVGCCSAAGTVRVADASAARDPLTLAASRAGTLPIACGGVRLNGTTSIAWAFHATEGTRPIDPKRVADPAAFFIAGLERAERIGRRVVVTTPDPWFDATVGASGAVMDGIHRQGIYTHSGMRWGVPLIGWRSIYGGTAYGWHDRVKAQAKFCLGRQIRESTKTKPVPDVACGLACQSTNSRLFGRGRVDVHHPWHYDMQTQFFDQLIHSWRWTGDAELEKLLRPALDLHLEYIRECFDPDGDGLYESYANTWPTDNSWFSGGGCAEETAYAFAAHGAAAEMARRAGDVAAAAAHAARADKIHASFQRTLWLEDRGHPGQSVEESGLRRVRPDAWLYAIFCPIDAGLLSPQQAVRSLHYTEWGLERERMPWGGQRCQPSNWVPSIWSLRQLWPGDTYALALAYFQTGLSDDAWTLLRGTFPDMALFGRVPGDLGFPVGGTDFSDCASPFARTVVEGLFGFRPDYPNRRVTIAPRLPSGWDHASIATPDFSLAVRGGRFDVTLARPADVAFSLPVRAERVTGVTVDGAPVRWTVEPGPACSLISLCVPATSSARVEIATSGPLPVDPAPAHEIRLGESLRVDGMDFTPTNAGHHAYETLVRVGELPQRRVHKVRVTDPAGDATRAAKRLTNAPAAARWHPVDLAPQLNGDVRGIFQKEYLSPRPDTCSLRLAKDGYSTWQMMLKPTHRPPVVDLNLVDGLLAGTGRLRTPAGAEFAWKAGASNIAFTSRWDNWPDAVTVPVDRGGDAIWFLVAGFTPPMQTGIANAALRMVYADGVAETLDLVPPHSFWSLCPFGGHDYDYTRDAFALPKAPPPHVQLGGNCRAMVYGWTLRPGVRVKEVTLETLSPEVIVGLMGVSVMNPE